MAGDWIKMRGNLWDDPRVSRLCDLTDQSEAAIVGALYWLWATADQHTEDGVMPGLTLRQIDRKTGIQGFGQALCEIKWLADHPEGVAILNFEEHNGSSAKKRCQTAKRVANHKAGNTEVTQEALPETTGSVSSALPREEKRREEDSEAKASGGEPPAKTVDELTKDELWSAGKSLLEQSGMPARQCGTFVGRLVKDYDSETVIEAVRAAVVERPADPAAYLKAVCQQIAGERKPPQTLTFAQQDELARRRRWEETTGRPWPAAGDVIDINPTTLGIAA